MKNTEKLHNLLALALQSTPEDFALQEVKTHIRHALVKLETVEKKRARREQTTTTNNWPVVAGRVINPHDVRQSIDAIDEMITSEKLKLIELANRRKTKHEGEDDAETILG